MIAYDLLYLLEYSTQILFDKSTFHVDQISRMSICHVARLVRTKMEAETHRELRSFEWINLDGDI